MIASFSVSQVINNFATLSGFVSWWFSSEFTGLVLGFFRLTSLNSIGFSPQIRGLFLLFAKGERGLFSFSFLLCFAGQFLGLSPDLVLIFRSVVFGS